MKKVMSRVLAVVICLAMVMESQAVSILASVIDDNSGLKQDTDILANSYEEMLNNMDEDNIDNAAFLDDSIFENEDENDFNKESDISSQNFIENSYDKLYEFSTNIAEEDNNNEELPLINDLSGSSNAFKGPSINESGSVTYDCVWFGKYWQNDTNGDGNADKSDTKMPIKWRVLSVTDDDLFLLSDKILDAQAYNAEYDENIVWAKSTIRSWINGYNAASNACGIDYLSNSLLNNAFSSQEISEIKMTPLDNSLDGGTNSEDRVFLLSAYDLSTEYGFPSPASIDYRSLYAKPTDFAQTNGVVPYKAPSAGSHEYDGNGNWWYRKVGISAGNAMYVSERGRDITNTFVNNETIGVRVALHISPFSSSITPAGTVCSDGTENEQDISGEDGIAVKGINMSPTSVTIEKGEFTKLNYTIYPRNATNKNVTWNSSNEQVAIVNSNGRVLGVSNGETTITATTMSGGYVGTCKVSVSNKTPKIRKLDFKGNAVGIEVPNNIPIFGGQMFDLDMPVGIPVNCVVEDGKIKVGINIPKTHLHSWNETERIVTDKANAKERKSFKEKWEDYLKNAKEAKNTKKKDWLNEIQEVEYKRQKVPAISQDISVDVAGYIEGDYNANIIEGSLVIKISGNETRQQQVVWGFIPVTFNCEFTASGELIGTIGCDFNNASCYGDLKFAASIGIEPYAGVGFGQWISGGIYGKAETKVSFTLLSTRDTAGLDEWTLSGEFGLKGYFATKEAKCPIVSGTHIIYSRNNKNTSLLSEGITDYSVEYTTISSPHEISLTSEGSDDVLTSNAYPAANPVTITAEDTTMLLYVMADTNRTGTLNQTKLVYRLYDNETKTFGDINTVLDDGTADCMPEVYSDGTDIYVAWLDSNKIFSEVEDPEIIEYMKTFGVRVAKYNAESAAFIDLGRPCEDFCYSYSPKIYLTDNILNLVWVENKDNALYGLTSDNVIMRSMYIDNAWTQVDNIENLNSVTSLTIGDRGNGIEIAYTVDQDNNLVTSNQDLYLQSFNNSSFITSGNISSLSFTSLPTKQEPVFALNQDGGLYYIDTGELKNVLPDGTMEKDTFFSVYDNSIYYLVNGDGCRNIALSSYDNGEWGYSFLTHETGYVDSFSNTSGMITYLYTEASFNQISSEWDTSSYIKLLDSLIYYDAELEFVDFAPSDAYPGMELPVDLYINNNGTERITEANVSVIYNNNTISQNSLTLDILPGESKAYSYSFTVPSDLSSNGDFKIAVHTPNDDNDNNNYQIISIMKADLDIRSSFENIDNMQYLYIEVENKGLKDSNATTIVKDESGNILYRESGLIKACETVTYQEEYTGINGQILTISTTGDAEEFYEMNNITWQETTKENVAKQTITFKDQDGSDLDIESIDAILGQNYPVLPIPIKNGFKFVGWYTKPNFKGTLITSDSIFEGADELYAAWLKDDAELRTVTTDEYKYTGGKICPDVKVFNGISLLAPKGDYTISYKNNINAYTFAEGDAGFNANKAPSITISGKGNYNSKDVIYFKIIPLDISKEAFSVDNMTLAYTKKAQKVSPALYWNGKALKSGKDYSIAIYKADDVGRSKPLGASVKDVGDYIIRYTGINNFTGFRETTLKVSGDFIPVTKLSIGKIKDIKYTGSEINPDPIIKDGKNPLIKDTHYTLSYELNKEVGTGFVLITGKPENGYSGTRRVAFKITGTPVKNAVISGLPKATSYTGNEIKYETDALKLYIKASRTTPQIDLVRDKDYSVSYSNNVNAGKATVTIKGEGGYTGTVKKTLKINPFDISSNMDKEGRFVINCATTAVYSKGGAKPEISASFKYADGSVQELKAGIDYKVSYKNNTSVGGYKKPIAIVSGKGNFKGKRNCEFAIITKDISSVTLNAADTVFKNKANTYSTKVSLIDTDGKALKAGTDYEKNLKYTYLNNTEVQANGVAETRLAGTEVGTKDIIPAGTTIKVTATAKGNFTNTVSGTYRIAKASITSAKVSGIATQIYTGKPITLDPSTFTVNVGKTKLVPFNEVTGEGDFIIKGYSSNTKKGTASVTLQGVGNYGGTKTVKFKINAKGFRWWWRK